MLVTVSEMGKKALFLMDNGQLTMDNVGRGLGPAVVILSERQRVEGSSGLTMGIAASLRSSQ